MSETEPVTRLPRRAILKGLAASLALLSTTALPGIGLAQAFAGAISADEPFTFDLLIERMRARAAMPHAPEPVEMPAFVSTLDYDSYRLIQFKPDHARWTNANTPYRIHAFHPGWLYTEPVEVFDLVDGGARPFNFVVDDFDYLGGQSGESPLESLPGIAGFRINYPLNRPDVSDELIAFVGASYFRALGKHNIYGLSARGLVLNSWRDGPEEFPRFSRFYLEKPQGDGLLTVYAELDSPSVTGAYRFAISPGQDTVIDVSARLFFRQDVGELGIAPLTSMFLYAESNRAAFDDYRPQVHDSNGLAIQSGSGESKWRPLNNPPVLANSYFSEPGLTAFGLHQRGRDFETYQDAGAHYERRPSLDVEPIGDWGQGSVRLIEIPSVSEADDNIVAFFVPEAPVLAGDERAFDYRLRWGMLEPSPLGPLAHVAQTRSGRGGVSGVDNARTLRKFVIDFEGGPLADLDPETKLDIVADVSGGTLVFSTVSRVEANGLWRLVLDVDIVGTGLVEMRAYLVGKDRKLTETWLYQWRAMS